MINLRFILIILSNIIKCIFFVTFLTITQPPMIKRENEGTVPIMRKMSKPRPESIISITSNISYTGVNSDA